MVASGVCVCANAETGSLMAVSASRLAKGMMFSLRMKNGRVWEFPFEDDQAASIASPSGLLEGLELIPQELTKNSLPPQVPI